MHTLIAGFGSSHGDDQAGWRVAAMLKRQPQLAARIVVIYDATQLLDELAGCDRLIVVDACRSGDAVGMVTRLRWPDPRIARWHGHSTHGVSVCEALELAEHLGKLPPVVEIIGIEVSRCLPETPVSPTVLHAVIQVASELGEELLEVAHA